MHSETLMLQVDSDVTVIPGSLAGAFSQQASTSSTVDTQPAASSNGTPSPAAILIRQRPGDGCWPLEVRVAVIGNVDSGKSTMVGVLTRSMLDDGRGAARSKVFKHNHEGVTGRTSAIGQHNLCLGSQVCAMCTQGLRRSLAAERERGIPYRAQF
jgi:hypothetical protein